MMCLLPTASHYNRCAPQLGKSDSCVWVVDFVNSAGALREAVEQFWGVTTHRTGEGAVLALLKPWYGCNSLISN
jgi:hypothetical protein